MGPARRGAFTLLELLVVLAILAILIAFLVPAVQKVRESANRTQCMNNLKLLGLACHRYNDVNKFLPPARVARDAYATWPVLILPFVGQKTLYQQWDIRQGFSSQSAAARETLVPIFFCPSRREPMVSPADQNGLAAPIRAGQANGGLAGACGDYGGCAGDGENMSLGTANGAMVCGRVLDPPNPGPQGAILGIDQPNLNPPTLPLVPILKFSGYVSLRAIADGSSTTLLLGEKHVRPAHHGKRKDGDAAYYSGANHNTAQRAAGLAYPLARGPNDHHLNHRDMFGGPHEGLCFFVFADASVRSLGVDIDVVTLGRLANRADGNATD